MFNNVYLRPTTDNYKLYNTAKCQMDLIQVISDKLPDIPVDFIISALPVVSSELTDKQFHLYDFYYVRNKTIYEIYILFNHRYPNYTSKKIEELNSKFVKLISRLYSKM